MKAAMMQQINHPFTSRLSPAGGNGSQPPPIPPLTSKNEFPFLRISQRQTRSKYKSQSPAIQPQQPPTSINTANQPPSPSSSLQQQTPTLTSHDHLPTVEPSSPSNRTKPSQANTNQLPASSPQPTQAIHDHSGDDQPAVTAPMHSQNQPVLHGQLNQEPLQDATTVVKSSQPQPYPTQTTPTSQKVSHTCTRNSVHSQLQLLTGDCQLPMQANTTESSQDQQTSQPKSLHACSSHEQTFQPKSLHACSSYVAPHAHEPLSAAHDLCPPCAFPTSLPLVPLSFPTNQSQAQSISEPNNQPSRMPSTLISNNPQFTPLTQNATPPTSAPSYAPILNSVPNSNQKRTNKKSFMDIMIGPTS